MGKTAASQPPQPLIMQIRLTEEERISGVPQPRTIERALEALHLDGSYPSNFADL